jgi:Na+/proline symporter
VSERFKKGAIEFLCVVASSVIVGFCIGLVQGWFAFGSGPSEYRPGMALVAAVLGGEVAVVLGPVLYYALLRKRLTWELALAGVLACFFVGVSTAWSLTAITRFGGWVSVFITPLVAILFSIFVRVSKAPQQAAPL